MSIADPASPKGYAVASSGQLRPKTKDTRQQYFPRTFYPALQGEDWLTVFSAQSDSDGYIRLKQARSKQLRSKK